MIYIILVLFFGSLLGIIGMVGRKVMLVKSGRIQLTTPEEVPFEIPYGDEIKRVLIQTLKRYENEALVFMVRFYVQVSNLIKESYRYIRSVIRTIHKRRLKDRIASERAEVSKFLQLISSYKARIKEIEQNIREEEKNL